MTTSSFFVERARRFGGRSILDGGGRGNGLEIADVA
jgi:hypothetical protein